MKKNNNFLSNIFFNLCLLCLIPAMALANDTSFMTAGNQLIPVQETDISIKKEILTITFLPKDGQISEAMVDVYYEFYNPGEERVVQMGFEAEFPEGDFSIPEGYTSEEHPFIRNFVVEMNGSNLSFKNAEVGIGRYDEEKDTFIVDVPAITLKDFGCVAYYFDAPFKKGLNVIHHTYIYTVSNYAGYGNFIDYWLTPAMRWAGNRIEDFTLRVCWNGKKKIGFCMNTEKIDKYYEEGFIKTSTFYDQAPFKAVNSNAVIKRITTEQAEDIYAIKMSKGMIEWNKKDFVPDSNIKITSIDIIGKHSGYFNERFSQKYEIFNM